MALFKINYYSTVLGLNTSATVSLPQKVDTFLSKGPRPTDDGSIPVLWLLPGMGDDSTGWQRYTSIEKLAEARGIAVAIPEIASLCFYANMKKGLPYLDFMADEFPSIIREFFPRISTNPKYNFIAGCSMGGYGSVKVALNHPEQYAAVGCFSSGNFWQMELPPVEYAPPFMKPIYTVPEVAFGTATFAGAEGTEDDLYFLHANARKAGKKIPKVYQYTGNQDWLLAVSDKFAAYMEENSEKDNYIYEKWDGEHCWKFWEECLPKFLDAVGLTSLL